jgi:flagellar biosynthesis GTPase FlhF
VPSQSVEAATREEAIAAAREEYGSSVKIVGVRRIRSGGVMGFFANERFVAEVDLTAPRAEEPARRRSDAAGAGKDAGRRGSRARSESEDDRMVELADLLRPASGEMPLGLYSSSGVAQAPAIEDLVAQRRPRTAAPAAVRAATPADSPWGATPRRSTAPAESPWGATPRRSTAPAASPWGETPARPASRTAAPAPRARTVAEARAAAQAEVEPFAPKRHRPTLDGFDVAPAPVAAPAAPVVPSPFTAALARMSADRDVSAAVDEAVERSAEPAPVEPAVLRQPRFEDEVEVEVEVEPFVEEPVAVQAVAEAPVAEPQATPAAEPECTDEPMDQRAVLQSALKSVLTAAGPGAADPDVERLLEGVLERVLAGDATAAEDDDLTATGRHRFPESRTFLEPAHPETEHPIALDATTADETAEQEAPVVGDLADGDLFDEGQFDSSSDSVGSDAALFDDDLFDDSLFDTGLFGTGVLVEPVEVGQVAFEQVPAAAQNTASEGWVEEARREEVTVHDICTPDVHAQDFRTQEFRMDLRAHEVLAHREPLVMTPSMAAWPSMARTASDPAPMPMDATMILPPLSLLPPQRMPAIGGQPPLLKGRPAVPPPRRPLDPGPNTASRPVAVRPAVPASAGRSVEGSSLDVTATHRDLRLPLGLPAPAREGEARLATVTRLVRSTSTSTELTPFGISRDDELVVRLLALGLPEFLIAPGFAADAAVRGTYAALTRTLGERLPALPEVPTEPGDVLLVVGPGPETLAAARSLAVSLRLDPARVQWATPSDAAYLAPEHSRITTLETAVERSEHSASAGSVTIVAVDAPLRTGGGGWLAQMLSIWTPVAVWGVVDATRKLEDVVPWLDGLPRLDAVVVQDTDCTADPAAVLSSVTAPVARVDGARATAHRWASLLCERLEEMH